MNREEFLKELEQKLQALGVEETASHVDFFAELFEDMKEEGLSEEEIARRLGDPKEIGKALAAEPRLPEGKEEAPRPDREEGGEIPYEDFRQYGFLHGLKGLKDLAGLNGLNRFIKDMIVQGTGQSSRGRHFGSFKISFSPEGIRSLEIDWLDGDVALAPEDRSDILISEERPQDAAPLVTQVRGDTLVISYSADFASKGGSINAKQGSYHSFANGKDLQISLPLFLAGNLDRLKIHSSSGDIDLESLTARDISLETASGDMELEGLRAQNIFLKTISGDLEAEDMMGEDVHITGVSGDVEFTGCAGHLQAESTSGDVELTLRECPESLSVRAVSGDISIQLPPGSACRLHHQSISGDVHIRGIRMDVPEAPEFMAQTVSGDVRIQA